MPESEMIYDIRTSEKAKKTLVNITGVPLPIWQEYSKREGEYEYPEDLVEAVVDQFGKWPGTYEKFQFICTHITTSANKCTSFVQNGILDLPNSYLCEDSELRQFLEEHGVFIDLQKAELQYHDKTINICYCPASERKPGEYNSWLIARKFYYDFAVCGFLSVSEWDVYEGKVHRRPEILKDIDQLLNTKLSQEWNRTHKAYEIVAQVCGENIVYDGDDEDDERKKVLSYLTSAYNTAFGSPSEKILLMKNDVCIPKNDILLIKPLQCWK